MSQCYNYNILTNQANHERFHYIPFGTLAERTDIVCGPDYSFDPEREYGHRVFKADFQSKSLYAKPNLVTNWASKIQMEYPKFVLDYAYISKKNRKKMGKLTSENLMNITYSEKNKDGA
jgi:hypothetical protein